MTVAAQGDEILFAIGSRLAPPNKVMNLELITPATLLALPIIALQDFHP